MIQSTLPTRDSGFEARAARVSPQMVRSVSVSESRPRNSELAAWWKP